MSTTLTSRMARENLDAVIAEVEGHARLSVETARDLMSAVAIPLFALEKNWEAIQTLLNHGADGRQLTFVLKEFADVVQVGIKAFSALQTKLSEVQLPPEDKQHVTRVENALTRARETNAQLLPMIQWLESNRVAIDPATLPRGGNSQTAEGYVGIDEFKSRLLPGA
jgi:hypothetical protein